MSSLTHSGMKNDAADDDRPVSNDDACAGGVHLGMYVTMVRASSGIASHKQCKDCPPGKYGIPVHKYFGRLSQFGCSSCPVGEWSGGRRLRCSNATCAPGYFQAAVRVVPQAFVQCRPCPEGKYKSGPGIKCTTCAAHHYQPLSAQEFCHRIVCNRGGFEFEGMCTKCPLGKYGLSITESTSKRYYGEVGLPA